MLVPPHGVALASLAALALCALPRPAAAEGGTHGRALLSPGSAPVTLEGRSGGARQAREIRSYCRGSIAAEPNHIVEVVAPMTVRLEVARAAGDTTMVVVGPVGVLCDDDSGRGRNPRIERHLPPGTYRVFVGSAGRGGRAYPYTLRLRVLSAPGPAPRAAARGGRFGDAEISPVRPSASLSGVAGGPRSARLLDARCRGYIAGMPDHVVTVTGEVEVAFQVTAPSGDTTLVVRGPPGLLCDDDSGPGSSPQVRATLPPGVYEVFVGSSRRGRNIPYSLTIRP